MNNLEKNTFSNTPEKGSSSSEVSKLQQPDSQESSPQKNTLKEKVVKYFDEFPEDQWNELVKIKNTFSKEKFKKASTALSSGYGVVSKKVGGFFESAKEKGKRSLKSFKKSKDRLQKKVFPKVLTEEEYNNHDKLVDVLARRKDTYGQRLEEVKKQYENEDNEEKKEKIGHSVTVLEERRKLLEERTAKLERKRRRYEESKLKKWDRLKLKTGRSWEELKKWGGKGENWKTLGKRVVIGAGISGGLGLIGIGAGVVAGIAGAAGGYFGQGAGSSAYEKFFKRDFRNKLVKVREEGKRVPTTETIKQQERKFKEASSASEKATTPEEREQFSTQANRLGAELEQLRAQRRNYEKRLENIDSEFVSTIKKRGYEKKAASLLGGVLFGAGGRLAGTSIQDFFSGTEGGTGIQNESSASDSNQGEESAKPAEKTPDSVEIPEVKPELDTESVTPIEEVVQPESAEHPPNLKDIYIYKGDGVTNAFIRQIENSEALREHFGLDSNASPKEIIRAAAKAARETGYISDTGEVRVLYGQGAGYELTLNESGQLEVIEHSGIEYDENTETFKGAGHTEEHHVQGQESGQFEGNEYEKNREYLKTVNGEVEVEQASPEVKEYEVDEVNNPHPDSERGRQIRPMRTHTEEYIGSRLDESPVSRYEGFTGVSTERYIPGIQSLGSEPLREYGLGSPMSGTSLHEDLGGGIIPQKIVDLFQNPKYPELNMQITSPQESKLIFEAMGVEKNTEFGARAPFKSVITGNPVTYKDIYERVDLEKLKQEVERLRRLRGYSYAQVA